MQYMIPVCGELELDATSAVLVVGLSSGELPLFCEVVCFCIPAFYVAVHDNITAASNSIDLVVMWTFLEISPALPSVPVLVVFVLIFKMLYFALALFYGFLKPLFFI